MASWLIICVLHNRGRASLLERRGVFVLDGDVLHALLAFIMRALFAYVVGGDGGGALCRGGPRKELLLLGTGVRIS